LVVFQEDAELAIEARLDAFAVFEKGAGLVDELINLLVAELVLFEALDG
jgi:hypothetical protein